MCKVAGPPITFDSASPPELGTLNAEPGTPKLDNITHSLVGIVLADLALRPRAAKAERRLFVGAGMIAANAPDLDLVYTSVTPAPLGYLLHHRGHTHTILGLAVLAIGLVLAYRLLPPVRRLRVRDRVRLWMLIALALASHIPLDTLNSYGVHPFYPMDSSWYYGDAVFIFEPWLWMVLGIAAAWSSRGRSAKFAAALPILIFPVVMASMGIIPLEALASLAIVGVPFAWMASGMSGRVQAGVALTLSVLIIGSSIATSRVARAMAVNALESDVRGRLVDVVLTPNPSSPLCWAVIGIEIDERGGEYVLRRGTMSLAPHWKAPTSCASHRFFERRDARLVADGHMALTDEIRQPLQRLRDLARTDCWTRAWLQFGRAPAIADDVIFDLRFAERMNQNFSRMRLKPQPDAGRCAPNLTQWSMPRADLLSE